jgi:hypothetical protein
LICPDFGLFNLKELGVVVPLTVVHPKPPDKGSVTIVLGRGCKEVIITPVCQDAYYVIVLLNELDGLVRLDWTWIGNMCAIKIDAKCS